jgi:hypothetical protein
MMCPIRMFGRDGTLVLPQGEREKKKNKGELTLK